MEMLSEYKKTPISMRINRLFWLLVAVAAVAKVWHHHAPGEWGNPVYNATVIVASIVFLVTLIMPLAGLILLAFATPLLPAIPLYFQGGDPYPIVLFAGIAFFIGWCVRGLWRPYAIRTFPGITWLGVFLLIAAIGACAAGYRYCPPWQWEQENILSLLVNHKATTGESAFRYVVFTALQYGVFGALILCGASEIRRHQEEGFPAGTLIIWALLFGGLVAAYVTYYQYQEPKNISFLANSSYYWVRLRRANGTCTDPNAFGGFISLCIVIAVSRVFFSGSLHSKWAWVQRLFAFQVCIAYGFAINYAGSRSGLLAYIASVAIALVLILIYQTHKLAEKLRIPVSVRILSAIAVIIGCIYFFNHLSSIIEYADEKLKVDRNSSSLARRIKRDFRLFRRDGSIWGMINDKRRMQYWEYAKKTLHAFPLTGLGLGGYVVELPNFTTAAKDRLYRTDNACNYYLQHGADLGYIGITILSLFYLTLIIGIIKAAFIQRKNPATLYPLIAFILAINAYLCVLIFGVHTLADESNTGFALLLAAAAATASENKGHIHFSRAAKCGIALLIICTVALYTWRVYSVNTSGQLNGERRRAAYALKGEYGFYNWENWEGMPFKVRWTGDKAIATIPRENAVIRIPIMTTLPTCTQTPQRVDISINGLHVAQTNLSEIGKWVYMDIPVPYANAFVKGFKPHTTVRLEVSPTWVPGELIGGSDMRELGVLAGPFSWHAPAQDESGFYSWEKWDNTKPFRWTDGYAWQKIIVQSNRQVEIPLYASHILLNKWNVRAEIYFDTSRIGSVNFNDKNWKTYQYTLGNSYPIGTTGLLEIVTSRVWIPKHYGFDDDRKLGVAVGEIKVE